VGGLLTQIGQVRNEAATSLLIRVIANLFFSFLHFLTICIWYLHFLTILSSPEFVKQIIGRSSVNGKRSPNKSGMTIITL